MGRSRENADFGHYPPERKNFLINGDFSVWQRGNNWTLGPANSGYLADRWYTGTTAGSGSIDIDEAEILDGSKIYSAVRLNSTLVGSTSNWSLLQPIEDYKKLAGKKLTVSLKVKSNLTHTRNVYIIYRDTALSSANQVIISQETLYITGDGVLRTIEITFDGTDIIPDGANTVAVLGITHGGSDVANDTYIADIQLEEGAEATDFEYVNPVTQLADCRRYYQKGQARFGATTYGSGYATSSFIAYSTTMRTNPVVTLSNPTAASFVTLTTTELNDRITSRAEGYSFVFRQGTTVEGDVGDLNVEWTADAEL